MAMLGSEQVLSGTHVGSGLRAHPIPTVEDAYAMGLHTHPWAEICLPLTRSGVMWVEGAAYRWEDSALGIFLPGVRHCEARLAPDQPYAMLWFSFSHAVVLGMLSRYEPLLGWQVPGRWHLSGQQSARMARALAGMEVSGQLTGPAFESLRLGLLSALLEILRHVLDPPRVAESAQDAPHQAMLEHLALFMEQHLAQPLALEELASIARLSPNHLNTLFRQWSGQPIRAWLIRKRMEKARQLLQRPGTLVKQVAYQVGYDDPLYFSRAFHRHFGFWPSGAKRGA